MAKCFQNIAAFIFCIQAIGAAERCCSDSRCKCVSLGNNTYKAECIKLGLDYSTFPRFYNNVVSVVLNENNIVELTYHIQEYLPETMENFEMSNNKIRNIKSSTFVRFRKLTSIVLRQNELRCIEKGTFSTLSLLTNLDLYGNKHLTFRVLGNISYDLQFTDIKVLHIDELHCVGGINTMVFVSDIEFLSNTSLRELYVTRNRLGYFEEGVVSNLPKTITKIDVSHNAIMFGPWVMEVNSLTGLTSINVGYRETYGGIEAFINCHDWRCPNTHSENLHNLESVNLPLSDIFVNFFPPNLKEIRFVQAEARSKLEGFLVNKNNSVEIVDMRDNYFNEWIGSFKNLHKLKYLDMSNIGGNTVSEEFFSDVPVLQTLKINNNILGPVFASDEEGKIFQHLGALETLEIANNVINTLPAKVFKNLSSLKTLRLSSNYIKDWEISISHMKNLTHLDLSSNRLSHFPPWSMEEIDKHLSKKHLKINLKDNVLLCTCDTLHFMTWMLKNLEMFVDFSSYYCVDNEKNRIPFEKLDNTIDVLGAKCSNFTSLIIGVISAITIATLLIIAGLVYRYRWKLRYMYYLGPLTFKKCRNEEYEFDAFISYSSEDVAQVKRISETIEDKYKLRLQLHQRDFIGGKSIAENITETIHKCRKTVIMLSPNFLKSYWCMFEFNIAHMESVTSRGHDDGIIIVILRSVKKRDLPLVMISLMDLNSYIVYPDSEQEENAFLENLQRAIHAV